MFWVTDFTLIKQWGFFLYIPLFVFLCVSFSVVYDKDWIHLDIGSENNFGALISWQFLKFAFNIVDLR